MRVYPTLMEEIHSKWAALEAVDWKESWKDHFSRHVFQMTAISPPWLAQAGDLIIEPGVAFGTGEHPTTARCLEAITQWGQPGGSCLDVGCGSGILALAAAKMGMSVVGVDIESDAIDSANKAAALNGLTADFSTTPIERLAGTYDVVVVNLFAELLVKFAPSNYLFVRASWFGWYTP